MDGYVKYLNYSNLTDVPNDVLHDEKVICLCMKRNLLQTIPPSIKFMSNLTALHLEGNKISQLPAELSELKHLEALVLSRNELRAIPLSAMKVPALKHLDLSLNSISEIPPDISDMKSLEILNLMGNKLSVIPSEICQCSRLRNLYLNCNLIREIPKDIGMLSELEELCLCSNRIQVLPNNLHKLYSLLVLTLDNNPELLYIPGCIGKFRNFQYLGIRRCFKASPRQVANYKDGTVSTIKAMFGMTCVPVEHCPLTLLDAVCRDMYFSTSKWTSSLPRHLSQLISHPSASCYYCDKDMFSSSLYILVSLKNFLETGVVSGSIEMHLSRLNDNGIPVLLQFCSKYCRMMAGYCRTSCL